MAEAVNHPPHYTKHPSGVECIDIVEHFNFNLGNAIKYVWRADHKNGIEDLEKAVWYLNREISRRNGHANVEPVSSLPTDRFQGIGSLLQDAYGKVLYALSLQAERAGITPADGWRATIWVEELGDFRFKLNGAWTKAKEIEHG